MGLISLSSDPYTRKALQAFLQASTSLPSLFSLFLLFKVSTKKINSGELRKQYAILDVDQKNQNNFTF